VITSRKALLDRLRMGHGKVYFGQPEMESDSETQVSFDSSTWLEMGSPEQITIHIQPGNQLEPSDLMTNDIADDIGGQRVEGQVEFGGIDDGPRTEDCKGS
jgi:hypothetical protein